MSLAGLHVLALPAQYALGLLTVDLTPHAGRRLYEYIARHFLGALSPDAVSRRTSASFTAAGETFSASGVVPVRPGFTAIMPWKVQAETSLTLDAALHLGSRISQVVRDGAFRMSALSEVICKTSAGRLWRTLAWPMCGLQHRHLLKRVLSLTPCPRPRNLDSAQAYLTVHAHQEPCRTACHHDSCYPVTHKLENSTPHIAGRHGMRCRLSKAKLCRHCK